MGTVTETFGVSGEILRAQNETEHFHKHVELKFIIHGHIHVVVEGNEFLLQKEEILLINSNRMHYIYVDEDALVCTVKLSYEMLAKILEDDYISFWCNHLTQKDTGYQELKTIFREIITLKLNDDKADRFRLLEQYAKLLDFLIRNYRIAASNKTSGKMMEDSDRVQEILMFINNHYQEPVSLISLAEQMYVSVSTLSRIFKKATGVKFPDYVNQIRMHYAIEDLLYTNKSITEIAVDNGFSSSSSFNRVFKEMYDTTPSQYKKSVRTVHRDEIPVLTEDEASQVREYLGEQRMEHTVQEQGIIDIQQNSDTEFHRISTRAVSLGAFYQLPNSSVQKQLKQMIEQLQLEYIRTWNIFSPKCMLAIGPEEKNLSFEFVDQGLDFLIQNHVHPFLDMTDHPEVLIKSGRKLFYKKEDSMGFQSLEQWTYFLDKLMEHVVFRYGREEVSRWIFELGGMPVSSGFAYYEGNVYKDVFRASYQIIKSYCPDALVGGPDWILDGNDLHLEKDFADWKEIGIYPDFYSVFIFPYKNPENENNLYYDKKERNMDPDFMKNQILDIHRRLKSVNAPKRPLYITETSTILSNRNAMNDHCGRGTNVLRVTNLYQEYADLVCFWVATDRLSLHYAPSGILHGGNGLMSKDGLPKPSYFALYFLAKLGGKLLGKGKGYMAVKNAENNIYILCYNYKNLIYDYKYEEENLVNVYNVDAMFVDDHPMNIQFMVHNLEPSGEYVIKRHIVNQEYGSVMDEWKRLGFEPEMRSNDIDYLKSVCVPRIQMEHKIAEGGRLFLEAELKAHEMLLLHIYK